MSRNNSQPMTHWLTPALWRSLALCLLIALFAGMWSTHLAGQNTTQPTHENRNVVSDKLVPNRVSPPPDARPFTAVDRTRMSRWTAASAPAASSSRSQTQTQAAKNPVKRDSFVVPASHEDNREMPPSNFGLAPDAPAGQFVPNPLHPMRQYALPSTPGPSIAFPLERTVPPQVTGSHLRLQPGETATERSLRLMSVIADLEEQNAQLAEQNAKLNAELKAKDARLQSGALQFHAARKELSLATEEFQRLRKMIDDLRENLRSAEKENESLMRSLSPLLKQLLQSDDDPPAKD